MRESNYDRFPTVPVPVPHARQCWSGWSAIGAQLREAVATRDVRGTIVVVECYPGVHDDDVCRELAAALSASHAFDAKTAFLSPGQVDALVSPWLGDDPVFGRMSPLELSQFLDPERTAILQREITAVDRGVVLVVGPAASLVAPAADIFVFADMPRWEGQLRQRRNEVPNLGVRNPELKASLQYKRSFFVDWRVCDRVKQRTMAHWDFLLDTTSPTEPRLITGAAHLAALRSTAGRPFRFVPFFDPGPWGGQWMKRVCGLDPAAPNYAWCFDCVPEENSLLLEFADGVRVEIPAMNLVLREPEALLGEAVYGRFGAEFPIRFDLLDTMGGGNLSLQVHPPTDHAREQFGLSYTQDESYYLLDAEPRGLVYLGCRNGAKPDDVMNALAAAQHGGLAFPDAQLAARFPARKHDHFLIPAGTLHGAGAGSMVLEISATPYIFTFKLWDWGRVGLDGRPRPIHLEHGRRSIRWSRDEDYARTRLVNQVRSIASGNGWREERTGLHEAQFIETRRHWFTKTVPHHTAGGVHVLNLVAGEEAVVESPEGAFEPFVVHYAETFVVPAAVGAYSIRPHGAGMASAEAGRELATMQAFVRTRA